MSPVFLAHLAATWGLVGLIWTIQCVHYPLFAEVGAGAFSGYHRKHTRRITWIVAPLMAVELITALLLVPANGSAFFRWSLVFLAYNWISTACVQIPLHNQLGGGFDSRTHARLVLSNWTRTAAWSARGLLLALDALS